MTSQGYQAVVIGSGLGGAAAAYRLAAAGLKTLVLERGDWPKRDPLDWDSNAVMIEKRYRSRSPLLVKQFGSRRFQETHPYLEEVVGGMSVFYGAAALRMRETDFAAWPIGYRELERHYCAAEQLLEVHGESGADPCEPHRSAEYPYSFRNWAMSAPAERIRRAAGVLGYRPFRVPLAINVDNADRTRCIGCGTCDGFPCAIDAKNDATWLLRRAHGLPLEVRTQAVVRRVLPDGKGAVGALDCLDRRTGTAFSVERPGVVVVSAGTIQSAALLLRSPLEAFPQYGLIGRHLMRHCNAFLTYLFPFKTDSQHVFHKQLCFTDFYEDLREELGTSVGIIQDMCVPRPEVIAHFAPMGAKTIASAVSGYLLGLLCIAEDDPRPENRVTLTDRIDDDGIPLSQVEHAYSENDYRRCNHLLHRASRILGRCGGMRANRFWMDSFAHGVGTLRFGDDPSRAVLDRNCGFFGLRNLFVLDGSFMPTSAGVNPSLTIVANSLRVAQHIASEFGALSGEAAA